MTPIAKMVREMIAKGVDIDIIELAVSTAEQVLCPQNSAETADERRRRKDRERKAAVRNNPQNSAEIHGMSENASLSKEDKKEESKEERGARKAASRGQRLPDNWKPEDTDWQAAGQLLGFDRAKAELEKFTDHWKQQPGSKGVKLDWNAAWRNWIRRAAEYGGHRNGHSALNSQRRSSSSDFFAGIASVAADITGNSPASGLADEEIPLGRFNIDG